MERCAVVIAPWGVRAAVVAGILLGGCARAITPPPVTPVPVVPGAAASELAPFGRPGLRTVPVPPSLARAMEAGTRTADGRPGPAYWQQRVDYRIQAELDPATGRLTGEEVVTYHNRSPDTLTLLHFRLYQNLFRPEQARTRVVPVTDGMTVERVVVDGVEAQEVPFPGAPGPGVRYSIDGSTLMAVRLPRPLPPGDSITVEVAWQFQVPPEGAPRTGRIGDRLFAVAQWYPQVAVYDDVRGWDTEPYLGNGEFYLEYGNFDVALTLPEGWLVAATGTLLNPADVLSETVLDRLRLVGGVDTVVHVVRADERGPGLATQRAPGGQLTWEFRAESVRDFAFSASSEYVWDATRAEVLDEDGRARDVAVHALYRPEATSWARAAEFSRLYLLEHARRWGPYPYPHITSAEGPVGGMEYPMLVFIGDFGDAGTVHEVIDHEIAHQWFPMLVGSNERAHAWQDEGLATYAEHIAIMSGVPGADPFPTELSTYLTLAGTEAETPLVRHADLHGSYNSFVIASYIKPALLLRALSGIVGPDTVRAALAEYVQSWRFRHPTPHDFFNVFERVAGRDFDWFWYPWWYETGVLDQAIVDVAPAAPGDANRVAITVEDLGDNPMPILLELTLSDGSRREIRVPVDVWFGGQRRYTAVVDAGGPVRRVVIDPQRWFPDVNPRNNVWGN